MVYIYVRYNVTPDSNVDYYSVCFVNKSSTDTLLTFVRRNLSNPRIRGITKFFESDCRLYYEFNSAMSTQDQPVSVIKDSKKHVYIVEHNKLTGTFAMFPHNDFEIIYTKTYPFSL